MFSYLNLFQSNFSLQRVRNFLSKNNNNKADEVATAIWVSEQ